jgi:hypothetical protein
MQNFDPHKERAEQDGSEWIFGAVETDLGFVPMDIRVQYLPDGVPQYNLVMDTSGCASRGPLNILETKLTYLYQTTMHPALKAWFKEKGYVENDKIVLNDNFIEILSGTTQQGNSLKAPVHTVYKTGCIPRYMLPLEPNMTWDEYMDPKRITPAMYELAEAFRKRVRLAYEQVPLSQFNNFLEVDMLSVAGKGWSNPRDGVYPREEGAFNHAFARVNNEIDALDNYIPYVKRLAKDFKFFEWGYSISIVGLNPYPEETIALFEVLQKHGLLRFFAEAFSRLIATK